MAISPVRPDNPSTTPRIAPIICFTTNKMSKISSRLIYPSEDSALASNTFLLDINIYNKFDFYYTNFQLQSHHAHSQSSGQSLQVSTPPLHRIQA